MGLYVVFFGKGLNIDNGVMIVFVGVVVVCVGWVLLLLSVGVEVYVLLI